MLAFKIIDFISVKTTGLFINGKSLLKKFRILLHITCNGYKQKYNITLKKKKQDKMQYNQSITIQV